MSGLLLVRGARQLLTLRGLSSPRRGPALGDLGLIQDGAVLIRDGLIASVGPSRRVENLSEARAAREIEASGRVVMPGFVDSHTHLAAGPLRFADPEGGAQVARGLPGSRLLFETRRTLGILIRHGTTTLEAKCGAAGDETGELKLLRTLAALNRRPLDVISTCLAGSFGPLEYQGKPDDYLHWMCSRFLPKVRRRRLAAFADVVCTPDGLTLSEAHCFLEAARKQGFRVKVHAEGAGRDGATQLAVGHEAVSADHLTYASEEDVALLAASSTVATLVPGEMIHSPGNRLPPARALIDAGAAVALASGFSHASPSPLSMQMAVAWACSGLEMTPAEALAAATINGAHALGLAARVGSLEAGKQADLLILEVPDYREMPYHFGGNLVALTLKRGEVVYRQGEVRWFED